MGLGSGPEPPDLSGFLHTQLPSKALVPGMEDEDEEDDSEDAINEFDFLGSGEEGEGSPDPRRCTGEGTHHELGKRRVSRPAFLTGRGRGTRSLRQLLPAPGSPPDGYASCEEGGPGEQDAHTMVAGPSPFPWKIPAGMRQAQLFLEQGLQPSVRAARSRWPAGRSRMRARWEEAGRAVARLPPVP